MRTFRIGGIHPPENKRSSDQPVRTMPLPSKVVLPLSQHIGAPAMPCVAKGDTVKVGTLLAKSSGVVSATICSPVSGKVTKIDTEVHSSGYPRSAVYVEVEGDEWEEWIDRSDTLLRECTLSPAEILQRITDAGIVGMGGAAFPTHVKLTPPPGTKLDVLIVNAVECEPYLTSDHALMLEKPEEILVGVSILKKAMGVERAVVAIENNKSDAIKLLTDRATSFPGIEIMPLRVCYPQGGEKQLIEAVLNRRVKSGALPASVGAVVLNVASVFAVYEAVQKRKPLIDRIVTVTGKSVLQPSNLRTRLGVSARELIEASGGIPEDTGKILCGGPMMGRALREFDAPVTKATSGILLVPEKEACRAEVQPCVRCAKCVAVCPMGLEPYLLATLAQYKEFETLERERIMDCIECGSCQYTCPSFRPLVDYLRVGKSEVGARIRARK